MVELIKKGKIVECKVEQAQFFIKEGFTIHKATIEQRKQIEPIMKVEPKEEKKKPVKTNKDFDARQR